MQTSERHLNFVFAHVAVQKWQSEPEVWEKVNIFLYK